MEQPTYPKYLFPELQEAVTNGFPESFCITHDGLLFCLANPCKHYNIHEVYIKVITCSLNNATLYLITTLDGLYKGVFVDYWEC